MEFEKKEYTVPNMENAHSGRGAWVILIISIALTLFASILSYRISSKAVEERFEARSMEILHAIENQMNFYEQSLRGGVGLFSSNDSVTQKMFRNYVESLKIQDNLKGIQGIGYSVFLQADEKEHFESEMHSVGYPDFFIKPAGKRENYSAIKFLEPFDWRNRRAFGYDMWSDDLRQQAMKNAMLTGRASSSGIITLLQETSVNVQKGFLMYLPVYRNNRKLDTEQDRKKALNGWVYSPFRSKDLLTGILGSKDLEYDFELFNGSEIDEESLFYDSDDHFQANNTSFVPTARKTFRFIMQDRPWILYVHTKKQDWTNFDTLLPVLIGTVGLIIDLLLFWVLFSLNKAKRRAQLSNKALQEKTKELTEANWGLEQFAYLTSHDLQEPLRTVTSYINLFQTEYADKVDDQGNKILGTIKNATSRMKELIKAILNYSRLGREGMKISQVDMQQVVAEIVQDYQKSIQDKDAEVRFSNLPIISGDRNMLKQLFSNLISNGLKYQDGTQKPVVEVTAKRMSGGFEFTVKDNGIGINPDYMGKIFEVFQRLHSSSEYEGTGIGLSICKRIIEIHQGEIEVESESQKGSRFIVRLPKKI